MSTIIYLLGFVMTLTCAGLLGRSYRRNHHSLLLWSALSFAGLAASNLLLLLDKTIFLTTVDLLLWRQLVTLIALLFLLYGLIWGEK